VIVGHARASESWELEKGPDIVWPEKNLEKEFKQYWTNRYSGRTKENFRIEVPYFQEIKDERSYHAMMINSAKLFLTKIEIKKIRRVSDRCFDVSTRFICEKGGGSVERFPLTDRWVRIDKQWFHVIMNPLINPMAK
jgi:hypothetical protein